MNPKKEYMLRNQIRYTNIMNWDIVVSQIRKRYYVPEPPTSFLSSLIVSMTESISLTPATKKPKANARLTFRKLMLRCIIEIGI